MVLSDNPPLEHESHRVLRIQMGAVEGHQAPGPLRVIGWRRIHVEVIEIAPVRHVLQLVEIRKNGQAPRILEEAVGRLALASISQTAPSSGLSPNTV